MSYVLLVYTYSSSAVVRLSIGRTTCARARACVTIFNFATICKRRNTDRPIILKERTCRRNPRSTSLFVIAYDRRCALYSSTSVRFSLLSLPPSIVLSYAPFRSPSVFHQFTVLSIPVQYCPMAMIETSNIFPSISLDSRTIIPNNFLYKSLNEHEYRNLET